LLAACFLLYIGEAGKSRGVQLLLLIVAVTTALDLPINSSKLLPKLQTSCQLSAVMSTWHSPQHWRYQHNFGVATA
jgi:hypothetical protein